MAMVSVVVGWLGMWLVKVPLSSLHAEIYEVSYIVAGYVKM